MNYVELYDDVWSVCMRGCEYVDRFVLYDIFWCRLQAGKINFFVCWNEWLCRSVWWCIKRDCVYLCRNPLPISYILCFIYLDIFKCYLKIIFHTKQWIKYVMIYSVTIHTQLQHWFLFVIYCLLRFHSISSRLEYNRAEC